MDFLLAYDEQTLVETLQDPLRGRISTTRARAFMEKIVQYPLSMPPLLTGKIVKMLEAGLADIVTHERMETGFESHRIGRVILTTLPSQLTTPRAIERFLAQVREQFAIHDLSEMNDVDLILATFLRVQFPDLFAQLQRWKHELTRGSSGTIIMGSRDDAAPNWEALLASVDDDQGREDARVILQTLFPAFAQKNAFRAPARRFAHPEYFDRYLAQSIPEGDIADAVVAHALEQATVGRADELRVLLFAEDDEQVTLALSKIQVRYPDVAEPWNRGVEPEGPLSLELLHVGMRLVGELPDRVAGWTSSHVQTSYWMSNVVRLLLDAEPATEVDAALTACSNTHRRAHVIHDAMRHLDRLREETQQALREAHRREALRILPILRADLRARDSSAGEAGSAFLYDFVDSAGLLNDLRMMIREGIDSAEFTVEDVAARFVGFGYTVGAPAGAPPSSASFHGKLFSKITEIGADYEDYDERESWADTSWARRKEFALRYITRSSGEQS